MALGGREDQEVQGGPLTRKREDHMLSNCSIKKQIKTRFIVIFQNKVCQAKINAKRLEKPQLSDSSAGWQIRPEAQAAMCLLQFLEHPGRQK